MGAGASAQSLVRVTEAVERIVNPPVDGGNLVPRAIQEAVVEASSVDAVLKFFAVFYRNVYAMACTCTSGTS